MEPPAREAARPQLPADEDASQCVGQTSSNQPGAQSHRRGSRDQRQPRLETDGRELQQRWGRSLQPELQDSNLSPALPLMPSNSAVENNFTEYSLFQQSDNEFAPLRAFPDTSMASERLHIPAQDGTSRASECGSLSQHPLAQETTLSEGASGCCSLSQHSLSRVNEGRREETVHSPRTTTTDRRGVPSRDGASSREKNFETRTDPPDKLVGEAVEDETFFQCEDVPAQHLLERLQKDIGMPSSSSSAVSSTSATSVKAAASYAQESKSTKVCKAATDQSMARREGPPGEASLPQQQTQQPNRGLHRDRSGTLSSEVCNITVGSRSTKPDDSSDLLHRELLSEVERRSSREAGSKTQQRESPTSHGQPLPSYPTGTSGGQQAAGLQWTGAFSAGVERGHREQELCFTGNQTGIDGSYLGFLPQSQSTPGVFKAPHKSSVKAKYGQLSAIESNKDNSSQSNTAISPQPGVPTADVHRPHEANQSQEEAASTQVQSLPSLNYMQKVDAWRANQSSGETSLFDSSAREGKKAPDAASEPLNHILSQQVSAVTQSSSTAPSGSAPRRAEAVGRDNTGSAARPSGRSQSQSSLSPVSQTQDGVHRQPNATGQPSPRMSLGHFSDVSDSTLSSSQDSDNSGMKLGTSIGASSVVSLEVDNYAPYWTTPPRLHRPPELNIEDRIPLYLSNLGIDQSPATILTPFTPRGPIREPEFSPTDLCTTQGSVGTPTKSSRTSAGPHKGPFSRPSIVSVDSSRSVPLSLDSVGPGVSVPHWTRRASPSSEALQSERRLAPSSLPDEDSSPPTQHQNTIQLGDRFDSESLLQSSHNLERNAERSKTSSTALLEIRKLLSQAENALSAGPSKASSASAARPRLLSDDDISLSLRKKTSGLQDSSSSATEEPGPHPSMLRARSSSDSMLTSEKPREGSIGRESPASLGQPNTSSTQAPPTAPAADRGPHDVPVGRGSGPVVLSQSARRAEPEGCSAAPPHNTVPPQPPVSTTPPALSTQQRTPTPADTAEGRQTSVEGPAQSSSSSPTLEDTDQGVMSDGSSKSSLAGRVAKLLQSESPATMVSSTPSVTDREESKAREWIKMKISGQQCETLELDKEDRTRIEEIKRELLLKHPMKSPGSTDTESSAASSVGGLQGQDPPQRAETLAPLGGADSQPSQTLQGLRTDLSGSSVRLQNPLGPDLAAQIREIAARVGVNLASTNPQPLTSTTIATRRRSTSASPSTSPASALSPAPELLHLAELSTGAVGRPEVNRVLLLSTDEEDEAAREPVFEPSRSPTPLSAPGNQKRQDTVGGQLEDPPPPALGLGREDVNAEDHNTQSFRRDAELPVQSRSVSGEQATGPSTSEPAAGTAHVSLVHLTPSPKAADHTSATAVQSRHLDAVAELPRKAFVPLRHSSSAASSPDEGVGLSSPPEWYDTREPVRQPVPEGAGTSTVLKTAAPQGRMTSTPTRCFTPSPRPLAAGTPALPVLLPYKPRGSEELFYVPQTEADVSSTGPSDTTMESSHTGSDDAVPPHFSSEVLGHRDAGLDRGVTTRHSEGIYSKRLKTATGRTHEPGRRGASQAPTPSSLGSVVFSRLPLSSNQEASKRNQGTSPVQFPGSDPPARSRVRFQPLHVDQSSAPKAGGQRDQERRDPRLPHPAARPSSSTLDQLWERFCDQWSLEESRPTSDREASPLQRLERLERLIHSTRETHMSALQEETPGRRREDVGEVKRSVGCEAGGGGNVHGEPPVPLQAWTQRLQGEEASQPADEDSRDSSHSQHLCPADRDESETLSTVSGSVSTVDTERLVRAFGAHRVQRVIPSCSLSKLYNTISKQKEGREQRRGRRREPPRLITLSERPEESTAAADSTTSTSTDNRASRRGASRTLAAKKAVKLVSRGVQAGDLELVSNATRRHARDVGTTFPSPGEARASSSSSSLERGRGEKRSPSQGQGSQRQRKSKRSLPEAVSWFISAEELRSEARKENRPEEEQPTWPSTAWFQPHSPRQVHQDRYQHEEPALDPRPKAMSSGLTRVSLQEALEMRRPEFISQSRWRVKRLARQVEERKLREEFSRGSDGLFRWPGGPGRLQRPAGGALLRRAVPRREMLQRSKRIYESLPEVVRRREEERRMAEYRSYRLNAQLYNKRITDRVLSRRSAAWR
ncbi:hypothetical protein VZT92_009303 [Zoarces viviparus]|uniref:ALMS motif domain-containing protein n=1 Tax=Zoarces viviparus TaxID=48416 RepID=A0AAW1FHG6_ZOAVI